MFDSCCREHDIEHPRPSTIADIDLRLIAEKLVMTWIEAKTLSGGRLGRTNLVESGLLFNLPRKDCERALGTLHLLLVPRFLSASCCPC